MKKIYIIILAVLCMSFSASAQPYNWGIGVRGGLRGADITARHYLSETRALNLYADFSFNGFGLGVGGDYEFCFPISNNGLEFYVGPGANLGFLKNSNNSTSFAVGIAAVAGLEYAFQKVPIAILLDYKPRLTFTFGQNGTYTGFGYADVALGLRFYF